MKQTILKSIIATLVFAVPVRSFAQNNVQPGPGGFQGQGQQGQGQRGFGQGGFGQGQGNFNPQDAQDRLNQFRQSQVDQMRDELGVTNDDEWKVILPKIQKVQALQESSGGGLSGVLGMFGRGGRGRGGQGFNIAQLLNPNGQVSPYQRKLQELQDALENKEMPESEVKARLAAVREERDRVRAEMAAARADLIQLLTPRQEAALFSRGILE